MPIKAVLFDAYGTLAYIARPVRPYVRLLRHARVPAAELARAINQSLTQPLSLEQLAAEYALPAEQLSHLQADLERECQSITLYPETLEVLAALRERRLKVGVCSNLALPYAAPLLALLPPLDAYIWSFEVGYAKPQPEIYALACAALGCLPSEVLMVGDTQKADVQGPRRAGLQALWLRRGGNGDLLELGELTDMLAALE